MTFSAVFFDVDDVVVDTDLATALAIDSMPVSVEVRETFRHLYETLISDLRGGRTADYAALFADIQRWQRDLTEIKVFSREVLMAIAIERSGAPVTHYTVHQPVDHYWQQVAAHTTVFPDALEVFDELRRQRVPFSFATNSDGFLQLDEAAQSFRYNPAYNIERKQARLSALRSQGVDDRQITIGDPAGKPHAGFYLKVIEEHRAFHGIDVNLANAVAIGDSLTSDVLPFLAAGVGHGAWLRRHAEAEPTLLPESPNVAVIGKLTDILKMIWPSTTSRPAD